jgi:hypothetical protein
LAGFTADEACNAHRGNNVQRVGVKLESGGVGLRHGGRGGKGGTSQRHGSGTGSDTTNDHM